jgi:DNA polymerase III subunit epsilon
MFNNVIVFDVETTGLSCFNDRVVELAALKVKNGLIVDQFVKLVKVPFIPEFITRLTGITQEEVNNNGSSEADVFSSFREFIEEDSLLVAHNAAFDLGFLHHSFVRNNILTYRNNVIDTFTICRERFTYPHKLENMCSRLGIELTNAHRALADVQATFELLLALHKAADVSNFINKIGYLSKYGEPDWVPDYVQTFPTENRYEARTW